jgi:hypothetical protein
MPEIEMQLFNHEIHKIANQQINTGGRRNSAHQEMAMEIMLVEHVWKLRE